MDNDGKIVRWEVVVRMVLVVCENGVGDGLDCIGTGLDWNRIKY